MQLLNELASYQPFNEQEAADRDQIIHCLQTQQDVFCRDNRLCHMTASAWVVNTQMDQVLMAYHKIYHSWSWLGGHADGNMDLQEVALKEVREESGVTDVRLLSPDIFSLEILTVDGHIKNGAYVSSHLHLNITYLLQADQSCPLRIKEDENLGVRWFPLEDAVKASTEPWFAKHIYRKLNAKLAQFRQTHLISSAI